VGKSRRIRRETPERGGPIRKFSGIFAEPSAINGDAGSTDGFHSSARQRTGQDPIAGGVRRAYQVIDEYIRQGRRAAEQFVQPGGDGAATVNNLQILFEQLVRRQTELLPLWLELVGALASGERPTASPLGPSEQMPQRMPRVAIEISSRQPAQVELDFRSDLPLAEVTVPGLHSVEGEHSPIRQVAFDSISGVDVVRIRVPDDQPSGVYAGVIVKRDSGQVCGSVTIRIRSD
jgi:hypothetical protein